MPTFHGILLSSSIQWKYTHCQVVKHDLPTQQLQSIINATHPHQEKNKYLKILLHVLGPAK